MAKDKKSFILYADLLPAVKKMPDDKAGELFKLILSYVNDENPTTDDLLVDVMFENVKQQLKRDLKKYEVAKENKANGGRLGNLKRWNIDLYEDVIDKKISLEEAENIAISRKSSHTDKEGSHTDTNLSHTIASVAVNDNVNVNDNVSVNVNDINNINYNNTVISKNEAFEIFWDTYSKKVEKAPCETKFLKLPKKDIENILLVVKDYVISTPDVKYRKNPLTWLNKKCWEDEIKSASEPKQMSFEEIKAEQRKNMAF